MRNLHLQYLRNMVSEVSFEGGNPFSPVQPVNGEFPVQQSKVLEVEPPLEQFEQLIPFCVFKFGTTSNTRDGRKYRRLDNGSGTGPFSGRPTIRYLRRLMKQVFPCTVEFWLEDPADDILSDARVETSVQAPAIANEGEGIVDQCLRYIGENPFFSDGINPVRVVPGNSGLMTDPAGELRLYKVFVDLEFHDGLYAIAEKNSVQGAPLEIQPAKIQED